MARTEILRATPAACKQVIRILFHWIIGRSRSLHYTSWRHVSRRTRALLRVIFYLLLLCVALKFAFKKDDVDHVKIAHDIEVLKQSLDALLLSGASKHQKAPANASVSEKFRTIENSRNERELTRSVTDARYYITPAYNSLLGNLMFQFASAYGIARNVSKQLHTFVYNDILHIFPKIKDLVYLTTWSEEVKNRQLVSDTKHFAFQPEVIEQARAPANIVMSGYFQSYRYFNEFRDEVRELFTFREDLITEADRQIAQVRKQFFQSLENRNKTNETNTLEVINDITYIAAHVRLGDILRPGFIEFGYKTAPYDYFRKAASYFATKYHTLGNAVVLIVLTEETGVPWCEQQLTLSRVPVDFVSVVANSRRELNMAIMTRLNATIISVGSFGWWGAFLANKETFYYGYPYEPGSLLAEEYELDDYYPEEWHHFYEPQPSVVTPRPERLLYYYPT